MGSRPSKPQPSARAPNRWMSNAWRSVKKSPRLRKKSKDSTKSKKSTDSEGLPKQLPRQDSTVSKSGIELSLAETSEKGNESPTENERHLVVSPETAEEMPQNDLTEKPEKIPESNSVCEDSINIGENNNDLTMTSSVSGISKGALSVEKVPLVDQSASSNENSPRDLSEVPVGTVFAFEQSMKSSSSVSSLPKSRKTSRDSARSQKSSSKSESSLKLQENRRTPDSIQKPVEPEKSEIQDYSEVDRFLSRLDTTVSELLAAALQIEEYLKIEIPKDYQDEINTIIGGTRLLCQDKLGKQFRNLCLKAKGEMPLKSNEVAKPTNEDLEGFWEMIQLQVEEMRRKIHQIHEDKQRDWKKLETPQSAKKKRIVKTPKNPVSKKNTPISEQQKKRDADRKARLAELRAKKLAMKQAMENAEE